MTAPGINLTLNAGSARDLMTPSPVTIGADDSLMAAIELFGQGFAALPVVTPDRRPVGVLSRNDLLMRLFQELGTGRAASEVDGAAEITRMQLERALVRDVMTTEFFTVSPKTPGITVVTKMLVRRAHHLFVVDEAGVLQGVITPIDVMFNLQP